MIRLITALFSALVLSLPLGLAPASAQAEETTSSVSVQRITGDNVSAVAAAASRSFPSGQRVVFVVNAQAYPDAMVASTRAGSVNAPVLLASETSLPAATRDALTRLRPQRIVVVGGDGVVSRSVLDALRPFTTTGAVERVSGVNRYVTAAELAVKFPRGASRVYLAGGAGYADAMSGAALAGYQEVPMALTPRDGLHPSTREALQHLRPTEIVVLGGAGVVSSAAAQQAAAYATSGRVTRISGVDRYATAAKIAQHFPQSTSQAHVGPGRSYTEALVAAAAAGRAHSPLLLTRPDSLPGTTNQALARLSPDNVLVVGTRSSVTDAVIEDLEAGPAPSDPPPGSCQSAPSRDTKFGASLYPVGMTPAESLADIDSSFGRVPVVRDFHTGMPPAWNSPRSTLLRDRDIVISFKASPSAILSGRHDSYLRNWFATAPENQTIYWSYMHEPEVKVKNGQYTPSQYRAAWRHIDGLADQSCKPNMHATLILTAWTIDPRSGRDYRDYDAGRDVVEVIAFDPYNALHDPQARTYTSAEDMIGPLADTMEADGRPWGLAELGSRIVVGDNGTGRAAWLADIGEVLIENDASFATYFQTTYKGVPFRLDDSPSRNTWRGLVQR
ncbi:cell wall-binding repeat-containing protein [uncultured Serinicoccus sp.]|uniref:cell wall-binding repeat-containing protein n=1 Tax=uncultured Serinicoccus sp. TaxID=735514 RepID=UPI002629940A|nr:cell wall-binding repeat-containing protein [uncultured Serinicoccus sp.]